MPAAGQHVIIGSDGPSFAAARAAKERGYELLVLVPRGAPSVRNIPSDIIARDFDPRDKQAFKRELTDAAIVYYCCGTATLPIDDKEPENLARLLDVVKSVRARFVYCDAPYAYGISGRAMSEELPQRARDPMGSFLGALAQFVMHSHRMGEVEAMLARHSDLIGPDVARSPFGEQFILAVLREKSPSILGLFDAPRSLTYAPDVGKSLILLAEQTDTWGQLWHLPSTPPVTPERLINLIRASASMGPIAHKSVHEIRSKRPLFATESKSLSAQRKLARFYENPFVFSSAKFERAFGLHATELKDLVAETVNAVTRS